MSANGQNGKPVHGIDVSIVKLVPRNERKVAKKYRQRIEASLRAVGLIDPLIVYPLEDGYEILDGALRYRILLDLGIETVPCLVHNTRDGFTGNRMVNQLSASQEMRMLRKSLEELDEKTIANALGMQSIGHRLNKGLLAKLHPEVVKAFNGNKINLQTARELVNVKQDRQHEILKLMQSCNDYSTTFARGLVLKTPAGKRANTNATRTPWTQADEKKSQLLKKLREAEQQQNFYSGLYRQYTTNLLKLIIYVRTLLNNVEVKTYLLAHHAELAQVFEEILESTEG
ncbi:ParB/RepB/Spo0J family partition protein [Novipirellula artificiosorum]|uniref:Chromosome-partitioning protein Spo0J n=1 Tax=Novipirellula artificiosorum TaxID=2528016 RepID=A0A5C6DT57_9BACT|nr:ParB N-terminal domain-containing protein [Novipirellula artificiosorum]TWU39374.1 Chromosome-partitioning protein Spo0J [Novipirellula artificiosorum]